MPTIGWKDDKDYERKMLGRFILTGLFVLVLPLAGCQSFKEMTSAMQDANWSKSSFFGQGGFFNSVGKVNEDRCSSIRVVEELNNYYELPESHQDSVKAGFSNATLKEAEGYCFVENERLIAEIQLKFEVTPGPFSEPVTGPAVLEFPYFVAVVDAKQDILHKKLDSFSVELEDNLLSYNKTQKLDLNIPAPPEQTEIILLSGFQLSDSQYEYAARQKLMKVQPAAGSAQNDPLAQ